MKVHFIQSGFRDQGGHFLLEARAWLEAVEEAGLKWQGYAHRDLALETAKACQVVPLFPYDPLQQIDPDPVSRELTDLLYLSEQFASAATLMQGVTAEDLVIVEFATQREIYGVSRWLRQVPASMRPHVAILVHVPDDSWSIDATRTKFNANVGAWRFAINQLKVTLPVSKMHVAAIDARLAELLASALSLPIAVTPLVSWFDPVALANPPPKRFDLLFAGGMRIDKGSNLVAGVVHALAAEHLPIRIAIQVSSAEEIGPFKEQLPLASSLSVDVIAGPLSPERYIERLTASRIVVLPYDAAKYAVRGSGIAAEAFGYGIPVVAPANTWIADRLAEQWGSGVTFSEHSPRNICRACVVALDQAHILEPAAQAHAPRWRSQQSAGVGLRRLRDQFGI